MIRKTAWSLITLLSLAVGLVSLRYLMPDPPMAPAAVTGNAFADPALVVHAGLASIALILGPLQFLKGLRRRRRSLHRAVGASYVACCLVAGGAGLLLALGTTAGPWASVGFGLLAAAWMGTTARALQLAMAGRYADHGRWAVRSFALTLSAVTLRLQLPLSGALGVDFGTAYQAIAFLCWIPNLLVAEAWLAVPRRPTRNALPA